MKVRIRFIKLMHDSMISNLKQKLYKARKKEATEHFKIRYYIYIGGQLKYAYHSNSINQNGLNEFIITYTDKAVKDVEKILDLEFSGFWRTLVVSLKTLFKGSIRS